MLVCLVNQFRNVLKESILKMKLPPQFVHILKGAAFSLTEKKWQYCQKIFDLEEIATFQAYSITPYAKKFYRLLT